MYGCVCTAQLLCYNILNCLSSYDCYHNIYSVGNIKAPHIAQCWFQGGHEHKVWVKPHGNSKCHKQAFCHTLPSTIIAIKEEAKKHTPKAAVNDVYEKNGGIMNASSLGVLTWIMSRLLIFVMVKLLVLQCVATRVCDPLFMVMEQSKIWIWWQICLLLLVWAYVYSSHWSRACWPCTFFHLLSFLCPAYWSNLFLGRF